MVTPLRGAQYRYHFAFKVNRNCMAWILVDDVNQNIVGMKECLKHFIISQMFINGQKL